MFAKNSCNRFYIDSRNTDASTRLSVRLAQCIHAVKTPWQEIVCLCIGSDRVTGDCLGPLIGHQLEKSGILHFSVYGTLSYPVHALNLLEIIADIREVHPRALVIAVDASLGSPGLQQHICVGNGSLLPGAGVRKNLPPVGEIFVTGIVNQAGIAPQLLLSSTRLGDVMQLADRIADGMLHGLKNAL